MSYLIPTHHLNPSHPLLALSPKHLTPATLPERIFSLRSNHAPATINPTRILRMSKGLGEVVELGLPWKGIGPFIFATHHVDKYPAAAKGTLGPPKELLKGRNIGMDMRNASGTGWNMYHGETVPGFPAHPHTGFETVSIVSVQASGRQAAQLLC